MVELLSVHSAAPDSLGRATQLGWTGLHHLARLVADLDAEAACLERHRHPQVMVATTGSGQPFAFHEGGALGHLLEIYEPTPSLLPFYARVAAAAQGWDGSDPVRPAW